MRLTDCLKKLGDAARSGGRTAMWMDETQQPIALSAGPGISDFEWYHSVEEADEEHPADWQPLLTEAEWRARYPLALRKLEEGEAFEVGKRYVFLSRNGVCGMFMALELSDRESGYTYYELPPLSSEESEPELKHVPMKKVGTMKCKFTPVDEAVTERCVDGQLPDGETCPSCGGNRAPSGIGGGTWVHTKVPAPNSVGERLTEAPEVGTPVVYFSDIDSVSLYKWKREYKVCDHLYRWHGPIPVEPKEEKPEPPKWLGAVRRKQNGGDYFVSRVTSDNVEFCNGDFIHLTMRRGAFVDDYRLLHADSPELAALFAGEDGQ